MKLYATIVFFVLGSASLHAAEAGLGVIDQPGPQSWNPRPFRSPEPRRGGGPGYYYPDYISEFPMGDNPYRYYRW